MARKIDDEIRKAVLKLATGYEYEEQEIIAGKDGQLDKAKKIRKHMPPNLKAIEMIEQWKLAGMWDEQGDDDEH